MKIETPILRRLGPVPFWRGQERCLDELERIYQRAIARANMLQYPHERKSGNETNNGKK